MTIWDTPGLLPPRPNFCPDLLTSFKGPGAPFHTQPGFNQHPLSARNQAVCRK